MKSPYRALIRTAAKRHGLDPLLVEAVVHQESGGRADAFRFEPKFWATYLSKHPEYRNEEPRRVASSYGLMQVMFTTAQEHGYSGAPELLFDLTTNLEIGCMVLARLRYWARGNDEQALAAYNGGRGNWTAPPPRAYALDVLRQRDALRV